MPKFIEIANYWLAEHHASLNFNCVDLVLGDKDIEDVTSADLRRIFCYLYDDMKLRGIVFASYEKAINEILQFACDKGYITNKPQWGHRKALDPNIYNGPDESKMKLILSHETYTPPGIILRLAWFCGLLRNEITYLMWEQVDLEKKQIILSDRKVPLSDEIVSYLNSLKRQNVSYSDYVLISQRKTAPMADQSVSAIARKALNSCGQTKIRLNDLRADYIIRMLENHSWDYVSYVSGVDLQTLQKHYIPYVEKDDISNNGKALLTENICAALMDFINKENVSLAGIAVNFVWRMGIPVPVLPRLTWDIIDFKNSVAVFSDRKIPIPPDFLILLKRVKNSSENVSNYIILNETKKKLTDQFFIQKAVQQALIRSGIMGITLPNLQYDYWQRNQSELKNILREEDLQSRESKMTSVPRNIPKILITPPNDSLINYLRDYGFADYKTLRKTLNFSDKELSLLLKSCQDSGEIVRVGLRYYLPGHVVPPDKQKEVIHKYLKENQIAKSSDLTVLLGLVERRQIYRIINPMLRSGEIIRLEKDKYGLPNDKEKA